MIPVIDMHCDTISEICKLRRKGRSVGLRSNDLHLDLLRMKKAGYMCQSFALFTYLPRLKETGESPLEYAKVLSDILDSEVAANSDLVRPALSTGDIRRNYEDGYISALKTIEEGAVFEGSLDNLRAFYDMGVRKSTLTWNFENELAYPNRGTQDPVTGLYHTEPETERGLKRTGREAVLLMEDLGMIIDVSHLGDAGILEILDLVQPHTPVIASHSNARSVTGHPRCLTDEMLRGIAEHGGITGVNFYSGFLTDDGRRESRIADMIPHFIHIRNVAGIDSIGLGSDFDGIDDIKLDINGAGDMPKLAGALSAAGFTTGEIEKIFYKNALRVYQEILK